MCSVVSDSVTPWSVARQAPLSMDFPGKSTGVGCQPERRGLDSHALSLKLQGPTGPSFVNKIPKGSTFSS